MSSNGSASAERFRIVIIGAGFAGLGMAIRLKQAGVHDFVILERADDVGGTWRDNCYPGCAVDVQSHLYSFSFAPNPDWSSVYSPQAEIWDYIRRVSQQHDVLRHVRFRHEVTGGEWDESAQRWQVRTTGGAFEARFVISGMGPLSNPVPPEIPGLDTFAGHSFHAAAVRHGADHDRLGAAGPRPVPAPGPPGPEGLSGRPLRPPARPRPRPDDRRPAGGRQPAAGGQPSLSRGPMTSKESTTRTGPLQRSRRKKVRNPHDSAPRTSEPRPHPVPLPGGERS